MSLSKFKKSGRYAATLALMIIAFAATPIIAHAQKNAAGPTFGSVDVDQVLSESKTRQRDIADLNAMVAGLRDVMQRMQEVGGRFLADAEIKELAALYEKKPPAEADKKRLADLEAKAADKSGQKRKLENTATPTEEQKKQYADLNDAEQKGQTSLKNLNDDFSRRVDARNTELSNKTVLEIKGVIAKIAQEKGLSVVFDNKVAIYTANDITADVVKAINK